MTQAIFKCTYDSKAHGLFVEEVSIPLAPGVESIPAGKLDEGVIRAKRHFKRVVLEQPNVPLKRIDCRLDRYEPSETDEEFFNRLRNTRAH